MAVALGIISTYVSAKLRNDIDKVLVGRQDCQQRKDLDGTYHQPRAPWETGPKDINGTIPRQSLFFSFGKAAQRELPVNTRVLSSLVHPTKK